MCAPRKPKQVWFKHACESLKLAACVYHQLEHAPSVQHTRTWCRPVAPVRNTALPCITRGGAEVRAGRGKARSCIACSFIDNREEFDEADEAAEEERVASRLERSGASKRSRRERV